MNTKESVLGHKLEVDLKNSLIKSFVGAENEGSSKNPSDLVVMSIILSRNSIISDDKIRTYTEASEFLSLLLNYYGNVTNNKDKAAILVESALLYTVYEKDKIKDKLMQLLREDQNLAISCGKLPEVPINDVNLDIVQYIEKYCDYEGEKNIYKTSEFGDSGKSNIYESTQKIFSTLNNAKGFEVCMSKPKSGRMIVQHGGFNYILELHPIEASTNDLFELADIFLK